MAKDSEIKPVFDSKAMSTSFGLLRDLIDYERKSSEQLASIVDPIRDINKTTKSLNDHIKNIDVTLSNISRKLLEPKKTEKVTKDDNTIVLTPVTSAINELSKSLSDKDKIKKTNSEGLKNLGAAAEDLTKLIDAVSKANPQAGKTLSDVLMSVNNAMDKAPRQKNSILEFSRGITSLSGSLLEFGLTLILATPLLLLGIPGLLLAIGTLAGLSVVVNAFDGSSFRKFGVSLILLSGGLLALGLTLSSFYDSKLTWEGIGKAIIAVGVLGFEFAILGTQAADISLGALSLGLMGLSIAALGFGIGVFEKVATFAGVAAIFGSVLLLGAEFAVAGFLSPLIALGAVAIGLVGLSIASLGFGLWSFMQSKIDYPSFMNLYSMIENLGWEYSKLGLLSPAILLGAAAATTIGLSIMSLSGGLKLVQSIAWSDNDSTKLKTAIVGVASAFMVLSSPSEQKRLKLDISPADLAMGILSITNSGNALTSLARGVSDFANLSFTEYDVIDGKPVIKSKTSLTDAQIQQAGVNIGKVISSVAEPLANVGKANNGIKTNTFLDEIFGGDFVSSGIRSISGIGSSLSSLAQGVQSFANMNFIEYEVRDGKLVPSKATPLNSTQIEDAGKNIATVLGVVGEQFANVGRFNYGNGQGGGLLASIFGGGSNLVKAGTSIIAGLGSNLSSLADSVIKFANLEFTEHEVIDGKIVVKRIVSVGKAEMDKATGNIITVLSVVAAAYSKIGQDEANSSGIFSSGYLTKGVNALRGVGTDLLNMTDVVVKLGSGSVPVLDGNGKVVSSVVISDALITNAGKNITNILTAVSNSMMSLGSTYDTNSNEYIKSKQVLENTKVILSSFLDIQNIVKRFPQQGEVQNKDFKIVSGLDLNQLSNSGDGLLKVGYAATQIGQGMKMMSDSVNAMDLKKLTVVDSLFNSLAHIANINGGLERLSSELKTSIENSFEQLTEFLSDLAGNNKTAAVNTTQDILTQLKTLPSAQPVEGNQNISQSLESIKMALSQPNNSITPDLINTLTMTLKDLSSLISSKKWSSF